MRRALQIELKHSGFRYWAPLFAFGGAAVGWLTSFPTIAAWVSIEESMLEVAYFLTPFVAGAAAWEGLREQRRHMGHERRTAAIPAPLTVLPQYASSIVWVGGAWVLILAALVARSAVIGLYGIPEPVVLLHSLFLILAFMTIGFAIAELIHHWAAIPLATVLPIVLYGATLTGRASDITTWINVFRPYVAIDATAPNAIFFAGASLMAIGMASAFAIGSILRRKAHRPAAAIALITSVAVAFAGSGIMIGQQGRPDRDLTPSELTFIELRSPDGDMSIRISEHYAPVADQLTETWTRIADLMSESDLAFHLLEQRVDSDHEGAPQAFQRLYLNPQSAEIARASVESALIDVMGCNRPGGQSGPTGDFGVGGVVVVFAWLAGDTTLGVGTWSNNPAVSEALNRLHSLDQEVARVWVHDHAANIRSCTWDLSDFLP